MRCMAIIIYYYEGRKKFVIFMEKVKQWGSRFHPNTLFSCWNVNQFQLVDTEQSAVRGLEKCGKTHMQFGTWHANSNYTRRRRHSHHHRRCRLIKIELMCGRQRVIAGFSIYVSFAFHSISNVDMAQWPCGCLCVCAKVNVLNPWARTFIWLLLSIHLKEKCGEICQLWCIRFDKHKIARVTGRS